PRPAAPGPRAGRAARRSALGVADTRPRKTLQVLAAAWGRLGAEPPLALVGAGPVELRYPSLAALAERAGARDVHQLGWVGPGELAWLYRNAELVLFPSLYEGFGFPLVEAFADGVPALASD